MSLAWRWLSRLLLALLALILLLAAIWTYGRLTSPTASQQAAIDRMQRDEPGKGENGFELLMALPPGPEGGLPAVLRCDERASCIAAIDAAPEASAAAIDASRERLEAAARALRAPVYRDRRAEYLGRGDDFPSYEGPTNVDSLRAFQFSTGQTAEALDATCTDTLGAVRWATNPDVLIDAMIGIAIVHQNAHLITDMRRRAPSDPLPSSCRALAEAPDPAVEGSVCNALRGEWHYQRRMFPELERQMAAAPEWHWSKPITPIVSDIDWQLAASAQHFASACSEEARRAAAEDRPHALEAPPLRWVDRIAFASSAVLMDIATPAYRDYSERQLDYVAMRRLLAAFLQMEAMPVGLSNAERFAALPAELRGGPRPLVFDGTVNAISVPLRSRRYEQNDHLMRLTLPVRPAAVRDGANEPST
ncbi:hypothetical protein [Silanimonas sp.]|uniref:hypothetical protein n=1 Tax=Silanimonas sp. TaxID=1929290 RepID=UPI0022CB6185|nr:hypothetical protein [Silanimonas sp.]MCZ8166703.1 hypothetical protein [Silanimonas sp.]